ncbi:MAG: 2OG-Fe(II) oxygenase [Candidatus Omnitrophica bacterium]|nr:2OG-Fe(II) oxygenase [Candidatus Omnitrophota bacterium]
MGQIFPYERWLPQLETLKARYQKAEPFAHIMLENLLDPQIAANVLSEFPAPKSGTWIHYMHVNEKKLGMTTLSNFGPAVQAVVQELNSPRFVQFLSDLTGIQGLFPDDSLEGGGLHQSPRGGFLNIHADFTVHPHHRTWRRRVNLLLYLNQNWPDSYGGHLELWDKKMRHCVHHIAPLFNRSVIFNTDADSFHGHPEPLACPPGVTRKSIALYYFTEESTPPRIRSTEYRARPGDGLKAVTIYLDKMILRFYDRFKRFFGINDDFASKTLKGIARHSEKHGRIKSIRKIRRSRPNS